MTAWAVPQHASAVAPSAPEVAGDASPRTHNPADPHSEAHSDAHAQRLPGALAVALARLPLLSVTYLAKLSVPPLGAMGLGLSLPLVLAGAFGGLLSGRFVLDPRRLLVYIGMLCTLWGVQVLRGTPYSLMSVLLMAALHLPYVFHLRHLDGALEGAQKFFRQVAIVIAICGLLQFSLQFVVGPALAFPIENFFPKELMISRFNSQGYLEYGSEYYRTNGIFMLEPSFFSQLLAIAIILELCTTNRKGLLLLFFIAMLVSYSGTGLMLLAFSLCFLILAKRRWDLVLAALVVGGLVVAAGLIGDVLFLDLFIKRAGEFTSKGSSGFARFVGGFYMFEQFLWPDPLRALFGQGAGSFAHFSQRAAFAAGGMAIFKIIFEFGIVGGLAYFGFLYYCVATSKAPGLVRLCVGLSFLLSGIYIPFAHGIALALLIWPSSTDDTLPSPAPTGASPAPP